MSHPHDGQGGVFEAIGGLTGVGSILQGGGAIADAVYKFSNRKQARADVERGFQLEEGVARESIASRKQNFRQFLLELGVSKDKLAEQLREFDKTFGLQERQLAISEEDQKFKRQDRAAQKSRNRKIRQAIGRGFVNRRRA